MPHGSLATLDDDAAIAELASGVLTKDIAARHGVKKQSLQERLSKHPDYKQAIALQADSLVQSAIEEHREMPADPPVIARARARADLYLKYAKAHNPAYADKQDVAGLQIQVVIAPNGVADAQQIEHVAVRLDAK
jgi:hypothetical protein